jgi:anti-anti-sigma regulatory factor
MSTLENNIPQAPPRYLLARHGQAFSTRARAEEIRIEIEGLAASSGEVLIDFAGVRSVSYSFADELVGAFASAYASGDRVAKPLVIGLSAQAQRVLLGSLDQRGISEEMSRRLVPH